MSCFVRVFTEPLDEKAGADSVQHPWYQFEPDLNLDNPEVRTEVRRIMGYWLELGVDGFRVDALPFLIESMAPGGGKSEMRFEYLAEMRRFLQWRCDNSLVLIHNFDQLPHDIIVKPNCEGQERLINLLVEEQSQADREARHHLKLEAYGYRWYRVGGLDHIIRREKA